MSMNRDVRRSIVLALLVSAAFGLNCSTCGETPPDVRDLANSMAEEFTDMLEFEDGEVLDGPPPPSDPDGPRLDSFTAPLLAGADEALADGTVIGYPYQEWFPVLFRSTDEPASLDHVVGCYAFVQQANKDAQATRHLKVEPQPELEQEQQGPERIFFFKARVHRLAAIYSALTQALRTRMNPRDVPDGFAATDGNAYHIYIALFSRMPDGTERVGNYLIWNLSTYPDEAGDNPVEMCPAHAGFTANSLTDTNLLMWDTPDPDVEAAFGVRPSSSSPCDMWNQFAAGYNTIIDSIVQLAPDPDYQERSTVLYPAGTRFFRHGNITDPANYQPPPFRLELSWCPGDLSSCRFDDDCLDSDHICCDGLCKNAQVSEDFCGGCDITCAGSELCLDGVCGQVGCLTDDDCPVRSDICCGNVCVDPLTDNIHCGYCDNPCLAQEDCQDGVCLAGCLVDNDCPGTNDICCGNVCYDSMSDPDHCGVCTNACLADEICSGGTCTQASQCLTDNDCSPPNTICCDNVCYNSQIDPNHCGDCITVCAPTEECTDATCVPIGQCMSDTDCPNFDDVCCDYICYDSLTDPNHCGVCNFPCAADEECIDGGCTPLPQCTVDADCPLNADICCGGVCYDSLTDPNHCGVCDNPCGLLLTCQNGQCCPAGGCNETVIAKWAFDPDPFGFPNLAPSEVAANVIAENFTSNDGVPDRLVSPGPIYWVGERDWPNPATNLMAMLSMEPGWRMTITRIEFDHAMLAMSAGMPDVWELSFMGGPGPLASGPIQSETPDFLHENIDIPPDLHDPVFVEILWRAQGGNDPGLTWGLDNVTIYGVVEPY